MPEAQGLPASGTLWANPNGKIKRDLFIGEPDSNQYNREQYVLGYEVSHRLNDTWTLKQNARYAEVDDRYTAPFDLREGPLMRVSLLRLAADEHVLVLVQHHIISYGWSMQVMVDELVQLYAAYSQGQTLQLPALAIQYADYAVWQRQWMEAGEKKRQLDYWRDLLGGEQPVLELPFDHQRPATT